MRTYWAWTAVLAFCVSPALAEARERGRDRGGDSGRRSSSEGRGDRGDRGSRDGSRGHAVPRSEGSGWRADRSERSGRREASPRASGERDSSRREGGYSDRGSRGNWGGSDRDRRVDRSDRYRSDRYRAERNRGDSYRSDGRYRGSYRSDDRYRRGSYGRSYRPSRRGGFSYYYRPRYPGYYRHGYIHLHGYYFPRYYYDYDAYPSHASIRLLVEPSDAEVYVDGYYAGLVDDFDGIFQRLHVAPGAHEITLRLDGFETWSAEVYAVPGRTLRVHHDMLAGGPGYQEDPGTYDEPPVDQEAEEDVE